MKLLQFSKKNDFDIDHIAKKREILHSSFPARLSSGVKRVLPTLKGYSWNYQSLFIVLVPWLSALIYVALFGKKGQKTSLGNFLLRL